MAGLPEKRLAIRMLHWPIPRSAQALRLKAPWLGDGRRPVTDEDKRHTRLDPDRRRRGSRGLGWLVGQWIGIGKVVDYLHVIYAQGREIMADLAGIRAGVIGVQTGITDVQAQITQLASQVAELVAGQVSQAELDEIAAGLNEAATALGTAASDIDAIVEPDAGEGEPTPTPGEGGGTGEEPV